MNVIVVPFMVLAALGFALSAYAHAMAMLNLPTPWGESVWFLHVGIFVVWLPAVLVAQRVVRNSSRKDFWKIALLGCPPWMRTMVFVLFGYALLNFLYFIALNRNGGTGTANQGSTIRGFSGHWLLFYGAAFAIMCSATRRPDLLTGLKCANGHDVDPLSQHCGTCGVRIQRNELDA